MKARKIFVVSGSEDGNLGVFSNVKNAWARAAQYLGQNGEAVSGSYGAACKSLADLGYYSANVRDDQRVTCDIERFYLNQM